MNGGYDLLPAEKIVYDLYIRILLPLIPIALASYMFGFPALSPLGKSKVANFSVVVGAVLQASMLVALYLCGALGAVTICVATLATETTVLVIRIVSFSRGVKAVNHHG